MKNYLLYFLIILFTQTLIGQNIVFSFEVDQSNASSIRVNIFARSSSGDENLVGYTSVFYYDSGEVGFVSYDQSTAQSLGWATQDFTVTNQVGTAMNENIPSEHNSRLELQQFDSNFAGSTVSNVPIPVGTLIFNKASAGNPLFGGTLYLGDTGTDPAIVYLSGFSAFPVSTEGNQSFVLPVVYNYFRVNKVDLFSELSWETASEINNDYFEVQRSADGRTFSSIGKVKGHGTTTDIQSYEFIDREPVNGINYYRLKQVDYNGRYEYSEIRSVDFSSGDRVTLFPNPTVDYINIKTDRAYSTVNILNNNGQLVRQINEAENAVGQTRVNVADLNTGVYHIELISNTGTENLQFIKVK